jgi:CheY-like chemotaxis protein
MNARPKVLYIDGDLDLLRTVGELLGSAGCEVLGCLGGATALRLADGFHPDVCVLDLDLLGVDGYSLALQLRAQRVARRGGWSPCQCLGPPPTTGPCSMPTWSSRSRPAASSRS